MSILFRRPVRPWSLALLAALLLSPTAARADEQGTGHYLNGFYGYQAGMLPPEPGLYFKNFNYFYQGGAAEGLKLPIGGRLVADFQTFQFIPLGSFTYVTRVKPLGGKLASGVVLPLVYEGNEATVGGPVNRIVRKGAVGFSDMILAPATLGWDAGNNHYTVGTAIFAPTGLFRRFSITPLGKNYWTFEPGVAYTYLNQKSGWELSAYAAVDFNTRNELTNYQSGIDSHLDLTIARHFPVAGLPPAQAEAAAKAAKAAAEAAAKAAVEQALKAAGVQPPGAAPPGPPPPAPEMPKPFLVDVAPGLGVFVYQQLTDDSGPLGTLLNGFRGRSIGLGPQIQATTNIHDHPVIFELKMLKEFAVQNRPQGVIVWVNAATRL